MDEGKRGEAPLTWLLCGGTFGSSIREVEKIHFIFQLLFAQCAILSFIFKICIAKC